MIQLSTTKLKRPCAWWKKIDLLFCPRWERQGSPTARVGSSEWQSRCVRPFCRTKRFTKRRSELCLILGIDGNCQRGVWLAARTDKVWKGTNQSIDGELPRNLDGATRTYVGPNVQEGGYRESTHRQPIVVVAVHVLIEDRANFLQVVVCHQQRRPTESARSD